MHHPKLIMYAKIIINFIEQKINFIKNKFTFVKQYAKESTTYLSQLLHYTKGEMPGL